MEKLFGCLVLYDRLGGWNSDYLDVIYVGEIF